MGRGLAALLILALTSFAHCGAMCGGFAAGIGGRAGGAWRTLVPYLFGKALTYGILGLALALGLEVVDAGPMGHGAWRRAPALLAGAFLVAFGLSRVGLWRKRPVPQRWLELWNLIILPLQRLWRQLASLPGALGSFGLGITNGLIPCGLSWSALLLASQAGPLEAFIGMFVFGIGTSPILVAAGLGSRRFLTAANPMLARFTGLVLIGLGLWTLWRGGTFAGHSDSCCS